jgi:hypothetical protein
VETKLPLDRKTEQEQAQHLSNAIVDASEDIDLIGMDRVKALSLIMESLVAYEIKRDLKDRKRILHEHDRLLKRMSLGVTISKFDPTWMKPISCCKCHFLCSFLADCDNCEYEYNYRLVHL